MAANSAAAVSHSRPSTPMLPEDTRRFLRSCKTDIRSKQKPIAALTIMTGSIDRRGVIRVTNTIGEDMGVGQGVPRMLGVAAPTSYTCTDLF